MNLPIRLTLVCIICLSTGLFLSSQSFGQYGGYGGGGYGGYGGGRMGGMSGMNQQQMPSSPRSSVPNIAGDMAMKETKWLKDHLSLTKDQLKEVKHLNNEYAGQQQDAIKDIVGASGGGRPSPETIKQIREVMLMFNEEKEEKLKPILTPEQWAMYQSQKPDMQKEIGGFRPPAPKKDSLSKAPSQP